MVWNELKYIGYMVFFGKHDFKRIPSLLDIDKAKVSIGTIFNVYQSAYIISTKEVK